MICTSPRFCQCVSPNIMLRVAEHIHHPQHYPKLHQAKFGLLAAKTQPRCQVKPLPAPLPLLVILPTLVAQFSLVEPWPKAFVSYPLHETMP